MVQSFGAQLPAMLWCQILCELSWFDRRFKTHAL